MSSQPTLPTRSKSRGLPLWTALLLLLLLAVVSVVALGAFLYFARSDKARLEREVATLQADQQRSQLAETRAAEEAKAALARNRQDEVLAQARAATNVLERLLVSAARLTTEATAIQTSEEGRRIALHPELVAQARRLYETDLPALAGTREIVTRLEGARRIEQQILAAAGTAYQPEAQLGVDAQAFALWGDQELRRVNQNLTLLTGLVQESKIKVTSRTLTASSPTLDGAIRQLAERETAQNQRSIVEQTAGASREAAQTVGQAEAERIVGAAKAEAARILAEAQESAAQQRRE
ncbi:MAG: hypothetical protein ACYC23_20075, partial [Limisphaerales bacterium]